MKLTTARIAAIAAVAGAILLGANAATAAPQAIQATSVSKVDLGKGSVMKTIGPKTIKNIGGGFAARRTLLSLFKLPPGTWLITTNATFDRTVSVPASATKTRPQLVLRYGEWEKNPFGNSAGRIMGVDISPTAGTELAGAAVQTVTVGRYGTVVLVYGFGVNDDGSYFASNQITVNAQITATRIG